MSQAVFLPDVLSGITLQASERGLTAIHFGRSDGGEPGPCVREAEKQLREYLEGMRCAFELQLDLQGTSFQMEVWRALMDIPYGQTCSYKDLANAVQRPKGFQAIGQANTRNPIPIVVPCHRVIAADGSIGGYGGGLQRKRELLNLETRYAARLLPGSQRKTQIAQEAFWNS